MRNSLIREWPPLVKIVVFAAAVAGCILGYLFLLSLLRNLHFGSALAATFLAFACLALNRGFLRSEGSSLASIGLNAPGWRLRQFLTAFIAGAVLVALWAFIVAGLSSSRPKLAEGVGRAALPGLLIFYVFNNAAEELAYRAYAFLALERAYGRFIAIVGTSAAFTLMHMQGGMPWLQALAGTLTNALIFGMLFYRWKSLPLTLGFHLATNVMQDVLGLRQSALTLLSWTRVDTSGARGVAILILVAAINLSVVAFLGRVKGTKHG